MCLHNVIVQHLNVADLLEKTLCHGHTHTHTHIRTHTLVCQMHVTALRSSPACLFCSKEVVVPLLFEMMNNMIFLFPHDTVGGTSESASAVSVRTLLWLAFTLLSLDVLRHAFRWYTSGSNVAK